MPLGNDSKDCLRYLGRALKNKASPGEQFCVFAFDCMEFDTLTPDPGSFNKDDLPFSNFQEDQNWNASFYSNVQPKHTERSILDNLAEWMNAYGSTYGNPTTLYVYSRLIPCLRDGANGRCVNELTSFMLWTKQYKAFLGNTALSFYVGWGNDDRDHDIALAIKHEFTDMEDDGIQVKIFPYISIA